MRSFWVLWLTLALLSGCRTVTTHVSPQPSELHFSGRVDWRDPTGPRFAWSGTSLTVRFEGTSLGLRLLELPKPETPPLNGVLAPNRYRYRVDGGPFRDLYLGEGPLLYRVAEGLAPGVHTLRLEKESESAVGETQLLGLELDRGARLLPAPPGAPRRLEFVGDSGLTGYGVEGRDAQCGFSVETQRHSLTWAALTARALGAESFTLAFSGKGVTVNYGDEPGPTLPQLYARTLPFREDTAWDFSTWQPDAVLIQAGANDFWKAHPGEERFLGAYRALVEDIRARYPQAHIVCILGSGISDAWPQDVQARTHARQLLSLVVQSLNQAGDARVHFAEVDPSLKEEGLGCGWHPSRATHQRAATQMTALLREWLGWR